MSTQTRFDLTGLSRAIERHDPRYQVALYADNAEVVIIDPTSANESPTILQGKSAIRDWIEDSCAANTVQRVLEPVAHEALVSLIEECQQPDGTRIEYHCTAEVRRGQIIRETITRTATSDSDAAAPASRSAGGPPAGNFLG